MESGPRRIHVLSPFDDPRRKLFGVIALRSAGSLDTRVIVLEFTLCSASVKKVCRVSSLRGWLYKSFGVIFFTSPISLSHIPPIRGAPGGLTLKSMPVEDIAPTTPEWCMF